jgi:carbon monoxide dehydrogenase subunit G
MDPSVISSCIPGCNGFTPEGEDCYRVKLTIALAAITGTYDGTVAIADKVPGTSYRLMIEGRGRPGFVKGSAALALRAQGSETVVDVSGKVEVGGPVARVGQRLLGSVSKMMQDQFFSCLQSKLT